MEVINASKLSKDVSTLLEPLYSKIVIAFIIVLTGIIIGKISGRLIYKILSEIELNKAFKRATSFNWKIDKLLGQLASYFIYFIFIMWALEAIGLSSVILNIIAGGLILLIVVAIALSVKDFIPNMIAGMFIQMRNTIREGDTIQIENVKGKVISIGLVETKIENGADMIYVPNSNFLKSEKFKVAKRAKNNNEKIEK